MLCNVTTLGNTFAATCSIENALGDGPHHGRTGVCGSRADSGWMGKHSNRGADRCGKQRDLQAAHDQRPTTG